MIMNMNSIAKGENIQLGTNSEYLTRAVSRSLPNWDRIKSVKSNP